MNIEAMKMVRDNLKMGSILSFAEVMIIQQAIEYAMQGKADYPVITDGWKLVPVELTVAMRKAFHKANDECEQYVSPDHQWEAMLAAAPQQGAE